MKSRSQKALALLLGTGLLIAGTLMAAPKEDKKGSKDAKKASGPAEEVFYIYADRGSRLNHYIPSGWMGDFGDIKFNQGWKDNSPKEKAKDSKKSDSAADTAKKEETCIQVKYTAERKQGAGWSGIYWQHPANNWGDKRGGFNLSGYSKLKFWARGEKGKEMLDKVYIGGITGQTEEGDSDEASISPVELSKEWKEYTIDLTGLDMSHIIGGFGFAANADVNPEGFTVYMDEIRLVK